METPLQNLIGKITIGLNQIEDQESDVFVGMRKAFNAVIGDAERLLPEEKKHLFSAWADGIDDSCDILKDDTIDAENIGKSMVAEKWFDKKYKN